MPVVPVKRIAAVACCLRVAGMLARPSHKLRVTCGRAQGATGKIRVATTISTLNSFVQGVGGEYVTVKNIVPVGASPETFAPTPQDVAAVADANVLVENGAGLESWLDRLLHDTRLAQLARRRLHSRAAGEERQPAPLDGSGDGQGVRRQDSRRAGGR